MNEKSNKPQPWQTPADLKAFESQLSSLEPRADQLDRERICYLAGQASVNQPSTRWAWPSSFAAMTALAATLLVMLINQPTISPTEKLTAGKSLAEIRSDFAKRHPQHAHPQGITTATVFREKELEELLYGQSTLATTSNEPATILEVEPSQRTILTPSSWSEFF